MPARVLSKNWIDTLISHKNIVFFAVFVFGSLGFFAVSVLNSHQAQAATRTWTGTSSGLWSVAANWGGTVPVTGDDLVFPAGASNLSNTNDLTENTIFNSITLSGSGYTLSGNKIILGQGLAGITDSAASGGNTIAFDIRIDATREIFVTNSAETLTISGGIYGLGGITKEGTGKVVFSGPNKYGGITKINVGTINAQHSTSLGSIAAGTEVVGGAALELQGDINISYEAITLRGYGISNGGALRNISGDNSFGGLILLNSAGGAEISSDSGTLTITGGTTGNFPLVLDGSGDMVFSTAPISGSGTITKNGSGTITFNFPNGNSGLFTINAGTVVYGTNNAILSAAVTVTGGTLDIASFSDMVGTVTLGTLDLANGTITGTTGMLSASGWTVYSGTISAMISGQGAALTKSTPGTVSLTRANQFTGAVTVSAGILNVQDSMSLGLIDGITSVSAGATLEIEGDGLIIPEYITVAGTGHLYTGAIRNKSGDNTLTGLITLGATPMIKSDTGTTLTIDTKGVSATTQALTVGGLGNITLTSTAPIYGTSASLIKNDTGTLNIQSFSNYTGSTVINRGTLLLNSTGAIPNSAVTVNAGGVYTVDNTAGVALNRMSETAALTMNGGDFNYIGNGSVSTFESTGALTLSSGHNIVTITPGAGGSTTMTFASMSRTAGASVLFRGTNFGSNPAPNVSTLMFTTAPTLTGSAGAANSTTISVVKGAFGDNSLIGNGTDMVTYNVGNTNGLRLLNGAGFSGEYSSTLTTNTNVKLTANTTASAVSINSLILNGFDIVNPGGATTLTVASASHSGNILINSANNIAGANTTLGITTFETNIHATANSTISAIIGTAVAGSLTLSGTGNVTLATASLYTGTTTVNRATLTYGASNVLVSGAVTVANGTLDIANFNDTVGAVTLQKGTITSSSGVLTGTSYSFREGTVSAIIAGAVTVTIVATNTAANGVVTMTRDNTYTGVTTITSGILKLGAAGGGTNTPLGTTAGGTTIASGGALDLNGFTLGTSEAITSLAGTGFGASGSSNSGALMNSSGTTISYSGAITLGAAARINADYGAMTISSNISGNFALTFGGFSNITYSGVRSGTSTLTKDGIGVLTLSNGSSSYSGATTISVGTVKIGASSVGGTNSPLGTTAGITTVALGARLDLNGFNLGIAEPLTLNGVGYGLGDFASGALMNSSASAVTFTGLITLGTTGVLIKADYGDVNLTAAGTITGATFALTIGGVGNGTLSSILGTTTGTLTKIGSGTWTLSGQNTFTGATTIGNGTLKLGANGGATNSPLGTTGGATSVMSGAVLDFNGFTMATAEAVTVNGRGIGNGGALIGNAGTFSGVITQGSDSRIVNNSGTMTVSAAIGGVFNLYVSGSGNITTSAVFAANALAITKQGSGTFTVTGANLYTGATRVDAGTFAYAATTTLVGTNLTVNGGVFNNGANADTIGTVTLVGGTITNSAALTGTAYTFESGTVSGILGGAVAVTKNTNNTVTLTGVNTISSTLTINAGTVAISGSGSAVSVTAITINLGGTLTLDNSTTAVASRILDSLVLTMNGGNLNFIGNSAAASSETMGQLALASGHNVVTVTPGVGGSTTLTFGAATGFNRTAGATVLFRGTNFGSTPAANVSTLMFTTAPTLTGAAGAANSTTISVLKGAFGDNSLTGTGTDMVTYNVGNTNGIRRLNATGFSGEYSSTIALNANVKLTANTAASTQSINSLILSGGDLTNPGAAATLTVGSASLSGNILIATANNLAGANTTIGFGALELDVLATANSTITALLSTAVAGSVVISGTGNVTLSAAAAYTGTTFINSATLTYGASNVISTGAVTVRGGTYNLNGNSDTIGALTLAAGNVTTGAGTITLGGDLTTIANGNYASIVTGNLGLGANRIFNIGDGLMDNDAIISAVISGAFTVTKSTGTGVLIFSGNNSYTGLTTISAGTLRLGGVGNGTNTPLGTTGAGTTVSGANSALDLNGYTLSTSEALTLSGALATGALQNTATASVNYTGLITLGAASTIISNYGDINIANGSAITGNTFGLTIGGMGNGTLDRNLNTTTGTLTKNGFGQWTIGSATNEASTFTGLTTISAGTLKLGSDGNGTNTPFGTSAGGISISSGAILDLNGFTLGTTEAITSLNGTGMANKGALINTSNNSISFNGAITLGAASRVVNYGNGTMTFTGAIGGNFALTFVTVGNITQSSASVRSGTSTIIQEGAGVLTLAGQNSFTGAITINHGILRLGASGGATNTPLGTSAGGVTVISGAVLDLSTYSLGGASTYETLNLSGSGIANGGAVIANASGNTTFGATTITASSKVVNSGGGIIAFNGTITAANNINFSVGGSGPVTFGGAYGATATSASLTKLGSGTLQINTASITTGLVRINEGTLKYGIGNGLASPAVTIANGNLDLNGFSDTVGAVTLIAGSIVNTGAAASLTSTATYTVESGTISAVLGGAVAAGIAKNTAGRVILSGDNAFTSTSIAVNAGFLNVRHNNALGAAGTALATTISGGATLELENGITLPSTKTFTVHGTGVAKAGAIRNVSGTNVISANIVLGTTNVRINSDADTLTIPSVSGNTFNSIFGGAGDITVSGAIGTTSGSVTKDGVGTLSLPGNNTYTGATTIVLGTVVANSSASIGNGSATNTLIFEGGTLQATGTITSLATRTVRLGYAGGTIDTNGNSVSIAGAIGAAGGLTKAGLGTLTVTGATTVGRDFTIANGTFVAPTAMTVNGDFVNNGTFTNNSGTVTLAPTSQTLISSILGTSDTTFNNLTITTAGSTIKFKEGNTYTIAGALTVTGTNPAPVSLLSVTEGQQWNISLNTYSLTWVSIQDSNCTSGSVLTDGNATITNLGNNTGSCWPAPVSSGGGGGASGEGSGSGGSGQGGGGAGGGAAVQATATATVVSNVITAVQMGNNGSGYTLVPLVCFVDSGGGSGAVGTAIISAGTVASITVDAGGSGYNTVTVVIGSPGSTGGSCGSGSGGGGSGGGGGSAP